jgi:type II secretory pathway predicted ATPase ExeA
VKDILSHFGWQALAYTRELSPQQHFVLSQYEAATAGLLEAVENRMSGGLIAPAGTGKTAVLRKLCSQLPEARYRTSYVAITNLSRRDLARELATALGLPPAGSYPMLVHRLQEAFRGSLDLESRRPVVILDDAHEIRPEVLGILRVLTNFEMDSRLVVSVVLAGQMPLRELLNRSDLEDVARRLAHLATLAPLSRTELASYLKHRVTIVGGKNLPLDTQAVEAIFEIGRGNLRATDHLTLKALQLAHAEGAKTADANHVAAARGLLWA